jgi:hypothetical protein
VNEPISMDEIECEEVVALPNKEVLSLLDVNANVDLGLDLAAPVDLAAAANLNVAAPIEAAATANVLSPDATAVGVAQQSGAIHQGLSGSATATAPQHAQVSQDATGGSGSTTAPVAGTASPTAVEGAASPTAVEGAASPTAVEGAASPTALQDAANGVGGAVSNTTGGVDSLLNGGSLLDANVNIHANANLTAPIDGAVAANANVAAPVDAAVGANIGSAGATAEALAPQHVEIDQQLNGVNATATATQDASVAQK